MHHVTSLLPASDCARVRLCPHHAPWTMHKNYTCREMQIQPGCDTFDTYEYYQRFCILLAKRRASYVFPTLIVASYQLMRET